MPLWVLLSLLFPILFGVVNMLDKMLVDRYRAGVFYYSFWIGVYELVIGSIILGIASLEGLEYRGTLGGVLTGAVTAASLLIYLSALKRGQVARVVPIWYLYPLMVAPMAAGFLGERLSALAAVAVVLAVSGGVLVSWQRSTGVRTFGDPIVPVLALSAAVLMAVAFVLTKHFLEGDVFWQFTGGYRLGMAMVMLNLIALPEVRKSAPGMVRDRGFMVLVLTVQIFVSVALIVRSLAINLGPVSLVAAISSIQPSIVFFYSMGLATLFPIKFKDWITRGTLRPQIAGITVITAGVVIISLQ